MEESYRPLLQDLLTELETAIKIVMIAKSPSLKGSDLVKSIEGKVVDNALIIYANDYYDFVDKGRKRGVKKVPIDALLSFIKKRAIKGRGKKGRYITNNQLAFAIQTSIFKNGIKGKMFDTAVDETIDEVVDIILDQQFLDTVTVELDLLFE